MTQREQVMYLRLASDESARKTLNLRRKTFRCFVCIPSRRTKFAICDWRRIPEWPSENETCYFYSCVLLFSSPLLRAQDIDLDSGAHGTSKNPEKVFGRGDGLGRQHRSRAQCARCRGRIETRNAAAAAAAAERAVKAAPQNARLWFLLGYASRLAGQYAKSVDAFEQGLKLEHNNLDGLSGLAQTYHAHGSP